MVSYHCSMPVLENVQVSLNEILEVRGESLKEFELWGILYQTTHAVQDIFLRGHAFDDGSPQYLVTPDNLLCTAMGRVILNVCQPDKLKNTQFWCSELKDKDVCSQNDSLEKVYVFTIGQTILHAAYYGVTDRSQKKLSPLMRTVFQGMYQTDVDLRMVLSDIIQVCILHAEKHMNGYTFSKVMVKLHSEVLGSLPENEILSQVDRDFLRDNETHTQDLKDCKDDLLDIDYSTKCLSYGHRLGYHPEISVTSNLSNTKNTLTPKERWKKAYLRVCEEITKSKLCVPAKDEILEGWKKHKAYQSIFRVYEELTERRKMLELLRLSINIGPSTPMDVDTNLLTTGMKPKTIADLVLLLQRPKLPTITSIPTTSVQNTISPSIDSNSSASITANEENCDRKPYYNIEDIALQQSFATDSNDFHLIGPEFVLKQLKPHTRLKSLSNDQELQSFAFTIAINLLTGETMEVECIPSTVGKQIYQAVADKLNLQERYLFGLVYIHGGEYIFLEKKQKVRDLFRCYPTSTTVISNHMIQLYFRVKFYLDDIHLMRTVRLRHLFYLQLRKDLLDGNFYCDNDSAVTLGSLALQAEFGDYSSSLYGKEYFLLEHYLPFFCIKQFNRMDIKNKLCNKHAMLKGVSRQLAELKFMQEYMKESEYGSHFYKVFQDKRNISSTVWLGIRSTGIDVYDCLSGKKTVSQIYPWENIKRISFSKKYFCIAPANESHIGKHVVYRFYTADLSRSQYLFSMSMAHHKFFLKLKLVSKASEIFAEDLDEDHYECSKAEVEKEIGCDLFDSNGKFHPNTKMSRSRSSSHNDLDFLTELQCKNMVDVSPNSDQFEFRKASSKPVVRSSSAPNPQKKSKTDYFYKINSAREFHPKIPSTTPKTGCDKRIMKLVKLQKDPKCGFGMVITCGNTYNTILHGAFVESVLPGSPAHKDGNIGPGDQILFVNGTDVQNDHFVTVVDLLQYSTNPVELVVAKSNKVSSSPEFIKPEISEKPFTKTKTWIVGDEEHNSVSLLEKTKDKSEKMPIPQPRKKWLEQERPVNFDVPDLTINHNSTLISDHSWKKENTCNEINGQQRARDNIPDIIASQIKYESAPVSCNIEKKDLESSLDSNQTQNENENFLLSGEIFHVVLDKKGGSLGLNIYQGTELTGSEQRHIYIHSIIPNGAADLDARIKPGDKLLEVNEVLLENLSYQEVVTKLRESPQVAHLVLEKGSLIETEQLDSEPKITDSNHNNDHENLIIQRNNSGTKSSKYTSFDKNKFEENCVDSTVGSDFQKDCASEGLSSYSSLPTTDAEIDLTYQRAKDKNFSQLCDTKCTKEPNSRLHYKPDSNSESIDFVSSPDYAKVCDQSTPINKLRSNLTCFASTPNLAENSDEEDIKNEMTSVLYRNKSTECLTSPTFLNPHQKLFDIYRNFSFIRSSSSNLHPIPAVPIRRKKLKKLQDIYDYSNPDNTFKVSIRKSSRGLGLSICGGTGISGRDTFSQLIRIRKLYPLQPALECGKLKLGDVILNVNGTNMVGMSNTEALEVLRTTPADVVLEVFRPSKSLIPSYSTLKDGMWPFCDSSSSSASSSLSRSENTYNVETGEFEVTLVKREGSLGFSISRKDSLPENSEGGIYVKALVREPAISDGRIHPGDKIIQVNGITVSTMSHAEAIEFIRKAPNAVTLKLFRNEPPPTPGYSEKDNQITKPLRWEALELLNGRMKHKENGDESSVAKRKIKRKLDRFSNAPSNSSTESSSSTSSSSGQEHIIEEEVKCDIAEDLCMEGLGLQRNQRPKSLDVLNSSDRKRLPSYMDEESFHRQSSVMCTNIESKSKNENGTTENPNKKGGKNLLKWRGHTLPHSEEGADPDVIQHVNFSVSSNSNDLSQVSQDSASDDEKPIPFPRTTSRVSEWVNTFDVDLDRGWHGRLGFSLYDPPPTDPDSPRSLLPNAAEVKAVHPGSLASKDGRIKTGDRLVEANRECLLSKSATEVIDILRKTRGVIRMVFCRLEKRT